MKICVYCSSAQGLAPQFYEEGERFGRLLARRGHGLVYGGYNEGVMGAVARGVYAEGGSVTAVVPEIFAARKESFPAGTHLICTDTMRARKAAMQQTADAFAVLPGGIGTFDEFFETLVLKTLGQLDKKIGVYNLSGCYDALSALLAQNEAAGFLSEKNRAAAPFFESGMELLDYLEGK